MFRNTLLTLTLSAIATGASAQVAVTGGTATFAPAPQQVQSTAAELGIPSVPAINTPFAHVGPDASSQQAIDQSQASTTPAATATPSASEPVNLGVASVTENPFVSGRAEYSGQPLGDIARDLKQKQQTMNAKTFTNADIDKLNGQQTGGIGGATTASNTNTEWPTNNGVITPPPSNSPGQGAIAAPTATTTSPSGNIVHSPFGPRSENESSPANSQMTPDNAPQAAKPSAERSYEMAQNNPANAGIPQSQETGNASANTSDNNQNAKAQLPKTASRLPLLGVLGFFSVTMGMFVRYQRSKETK